MSRPTPPASRVIASLPTLLEPPIREPGRRDADLPSAPEHDLFPLPDVLEHGASEPFRYCLNTSTLRGQKLSLPELVDVAAGAGFEAIEPWIDEIEGFDASGGDLRDLRARIADLGLTVEGGIGFFEWIVDDPDRRADGLKAARQAMGLLAKLGGTRIAAPPFGAHAHGSPLLDPDAVAERYRALLAVGDDVGVVPQIEIWGGSANLSRLGDAARAAIDSAHPDACILADVYHLYKGGSPREGLRLLSARALPLLHVNDYPEIPRAEITDADRVFPGDGVAPLTSILRDLRSMGFSGFLSLELFNPEYYEWEPLRVARTGMEKLREVVKRSFD